MYLHRAFEPENLTHAKNIVLTPDPDDPDKFELETNYLMEVLLNLKIITKESIVIDYGCGMGRLSKPIIDIFNCRVLGIDQSPNMLKYADQYVNNKLFKTSCESCITNADLLISTFVLQHSEHPEQDIDNFYQMLKQGGIVVLVNEHNRYVPVGLTNDNYVIWQDDKIDVIELMRKRFSLIRKSIYYNGNDILTIWKKL